MRSHSRHFHLDLFLILNILNVYSLHALIVWLVSLNFLADWKASVRILRIWLSIDQVKNILVFLSVWIMLRSLWWPSIILQLIRLWSDLLNLINWLHISNIIISILDFHLNLLLRLSLISWRWMLLIEIFGFHLGWVASGWWFFHLYNLILS